MDDQKVVSARHAFYNHGPLPGITKTDLIVAAIETTFLRLSSM